MFGVIPRVLWQQQHNPDELNRILQALRIMLIIDGDRKILVDVGLGGWHNEKFYDRYAIDNSSFDFETALTKYNLSREDITDIIITHLHFDHAGGLVTKTNSKIQPTFPNARIWVQKRHWLWAQNPSPKDQGSFISLYMNFLSNWPKLKLIDTDTKITPNISLFVFDGHTAAMQTVLIEAGNQKHFFASDLIPTASHLRLSYTMAYDNNSVLAVEEKQKILPRAIHENWLIYFPHDPACEKGYVKIKNERYTLKKD